MVHSLNNIFKKKRVSLTSKGWTSLWNWAFDSKFLPEVDRYVVKHWCKKIRSFPQPFSQRNFLRNRKNPSTRCKNRCLTGYEKGIERCLNSTRGVKDDAESIYTKQSGIRQFSLWVTVKILFFLKSQKRGKKRGKKSTVQIIKTYPNGMKRRLGVIWIAYICFLLRIWFEQKLWYTYRATLYRCKIYVCVSTAPMKRI